MGKLFYIIGKSSSGKDSVLRHLAGDASLHLQQITPYTTRPKRDGEEEGREYHFITDEESERLKEAGRIIEIRAYNTVHGIWKYMMVDDGAVDLTKQDYIAVGTAESFRQIYAYYPKGTVIPIYIDVEKGERLYRALLRERKSDHPKYEEMCRRFLADEADFAPEKLKEAGLLLEDGSIWNRIENIKLKSTVEAAKALIEKERG